MAWGEPSTPLPCPFSSCPIGFLGEGDAVTKAIQDARQLLHSHSGALDSSPNTPFRKVWPPLPCAWQQGTDGGQGRKAGLEATKGRGGGGKWGDRGRLMCRLSRQSQDLISLDMSPVKERLEETCVHPLEEVMLGCDVDGEALGPELVGRGARLCFLPGPEWAGHVCGVPYGSVCPWAPGLASAGCCGSPWRALVVNHGVLFLLSLTDCPSLFLLPR